MKNFKKILHLVMAASFVCLTVSSHLAAQNRDAAKAEGKAFAKEQIKRAQSEAKTSPDASRVPNFQSAPPQSAYADNPQGIEGDARAAARSHDGYNAVKESQARRARFDPDDIKTQQNARRTSTKIRLALPPAWKSVAREVAACPPALTQIAGAIYCNL